MVAAEPHCRLYLALPATPSATVEAMLIRAPSEAEPACVLLTDDATAAADPAWDLRLRELTAVRGIALLVENDAERAGLLGADGVHLPPDVALYQQARERLGQRAIIGVGCIESRHDAMLLAELGADYVAFRTMRGPNGGPRESLAELIAWWSDIFVVPCVAWNVETAEEAERLASLGADFVAPAAALWRSEGAVQAIDEIGTALRRGRTAA